MSLRILCLGLVFLFLFSACEEPIVEPTKTYSSGVFVINEGIFGSTSGTVSHYKREDKTVTQKIFNKANNRDLGDVVQSMLIHNEKAYIVVNNSNKIEVADAENFQEKAQITNLKLPRYFLPISNTKAYVSEWGADGLTGTIAVLDLTSNTILSSIPVSVGPEGMLLKDGKVYVAHVGGYDSNNKITIINASTNLVESTITVLDKPGHLVEDINGNLWTACGGKTIYTTYPDVDTVNSTVSGLVKISSSTNTVGKTISFGKGQPVSNLTINKTNKNLLYYTRNSKVWEYNISTDTERLLFEGSFYGLGYDANVQYLYAITSSGINNAYVKRYQENGNLVDSFQVGVFANACVFLP